jgi:hypothetical protein
MTELPLGLALLAWGTAVHLVVWRAALPRNHTHGLLVVFALAPIAAAGVIGLLRPSWLPADAAAWLRLGFLYLPCALAYIVCYSAIEQESATLALAVRLTEAGEAGMTRETLRQSLACEDIGGRRLSSLVASGLVRTDCGGYALTGKGRVFARIFSVAESIAGLPRGG